MTPSTVAAMCGDYRASFHIDQRHDADDREAGRRIAAPCSSSPEPRRRSSHDAGDVWRRWAVTVTASTVPGGHFVPEESPVALLDELIPFLG